jgi:hypothetical protein
MNNVMKLRNVSSLVVMLICASLAWGCNNGDDEVLNNSGSKNPSSPKPVDLPIRGNILFVGNSLTYSNDLPSLVTVLAQKRGFLVNVKSIAEPNTAISDHWESGAVQKAMDEMDFDFVVIQQGPSSQIDGRVLLIEYGAKYKELCEAKGAQLAFFMVWPARANYNTFDGVIKNYTDAAKLNNSLLCPVGKDWKEYQDMTKDFSYYGPDQFHPSPKGSEVAAGIILATLFP